MSEDLFDTESDINSDRDSLREFILISDSDVSTQPPSDDDEPVDPLSTYEEFSSTVQKQPLFNRTGQW